MRTANVLASIHHTPVTYPVATSAGKGYFKMNNEYEYTKLGQSYVSYIPL